MLESLTFTARDINYSAEHKKKPRSFLTRAVSLG